MRGPPQTSVYDADAKKQRENSAVGRGKRRRNTRRAASVGGGTIRAALDLDLAHPAAVAARVKVWRSILLYRMTTVTCMPGGEQMSEERSLVSCFAQSFGVRVASRKAGNAAGQLRNELPSVKQGTASPSSAADNTAAANTCGPTLCCGVCVGKESPTCRCRSPPSRAVGRLGKQQRRGLCATACIARMQLQGLTCTRKKAEGEREWPSNSSFRHDGVIHGAF